MYKTLRRKPRKVVLSIVPNHLIKKRLYNEVFLQMLSEIAKFKAFEFKSNDEFSNRTPAGEYRVVLYEPNNEKRIIEVIKKFNFEIIS